MPFEDDELPLQHADDRLPERTDNLHEVFVGDLEPVLVLVDLCHAIGADDRFRGRNSFE